MSGQAQRQRQKYWGALAVVGLLLTAVGVLLGSGFGAIAAPAGAGSTATTSPPTVMSTPLKFTCRVADKVNAWDSGLTSQITITYTGVAPVRGWSLVFALPSGQTITSGWNAVYSPASGQVTATNAPYNADLDTGGSVSIGFQATHTGDTGAPAYFVLNGSGCVMD